MAKNTTLKNELSAKEAICIIIPAFFLAVGIIGIMWWWLTR